MDRPPFEPLARLLLILQVNAITKTTLAAPFLVRAVRYRQEELLKTTW